jgi:hypothetical protein
MYLGVIGQSHVVHSAYLFILPIEEQAGLEPVVVAEINGANFSQLNMVCGRHSTSEGFRMLHSLILGDALFLLDRGGKREGKKKKKKGERSHHGGGGFSWASICLAGCDTGCSC